MAKRKINAQNRSKRDSKALLAKRFEKVTALAKAPTMTVTLRIPSELNKWLDSYVHLSYPQKIAKQALVIEALSLCYLRRGEPKERILDLIGIPSQSNE